MINIEEITRDADCASWDKVYGAPVYWGERSIKERSRALTLGVIIAKRVVEQCIREVGAVSVAAPDAEIVKEKISAHLRTLAHEIHL